MSRKLLAHHAGISERYLTQLESGKGNVSLLLLRHIAAALGVPLSRLVAEETVQEFLARLTADQLEEARAYLSAAVTDDFRSGRIALVGLRGAGKTTIGAAAAKE